MTMMAQQEAEERGKRKEAGDDKNNDQHWLLTACLALAWLCSELFSCGDIY